jgi:hypothetical protein
MPRLSAFDEAALLRTLNGQYSVIGRRQAAACGMTEKAVRYRIKPGGPWQSILPGVYVAHTSRLTGMQRQMAAWLYADRAIAITGQAAAVRHGILTRPSDFVDVLVPLSCRRMDAGFARLHRTGVVPQLFSGGGTQIRYASPARAVADAVRQLCDTSDVRALVAAGVQRGKVEIWQLERCLADGPVRGSAGLRRILAEVADGVMSAAEGDLHDLLRKSGLPPPLLNPELFDATAFVARPDAWWPEFGVVVEVDSRAWHLSPADWERTMERHVRMTKLGILVLHFAPTTIRDIGPQVVAAIRSALASSRGPLPHMVTVPAQRAQAS